jgi:hypothetical protein
MSTPSNYPDVIQARKDTYYTSVVLKNDRKDDFQLLMASQQYGTFYAIYARFGLIMQGPQKKLNNILFRIINYKGLINVGIESIKLPEINNEDSNKIEIDIILKGFMRPLQDYVYDLAPENIFLVNGTQITFHRVLRNFVSDPHQSFNEGAFDEEFHFRDGLYPILAPVADLEDRIEAETSDGMGIGKRCPYSVVRIEIPDE